MPLKKPLALVSGRRTEISANDIIDVVGPHFEKLNYVSGVVTEVEYFNLASMLVTSRAAKRILTYTSELLTTEVLVVYAANGTTAIKTFTWTYTYSGDDVQSSALVIT